MNSKGVMHYADGSKMLAICSNDRWNGTRLITNHDSSVTCDLCKEMRKKK